MSKMAASRQQKIIPSTLPNNATLCLPPLDAAPCEDGVPAPVAYTLRLPNDVAKALIASTDATVTFEAESEGVITIPGVRNVFFKARQINDVNNETARATCFSRRSTLVRTVGPILADIEVVEHRPPNYNPKKRALEAASQRRPELKPMSEATPHGKRQRKSKASPVRERPHPSPRSAPTSRPGPKLQSQPLPPLSSRPPLVSKPIPARNLFAASNPPSTSRPPQLPAQNGVDVSRPPLRSAPAPSYRLPLSPNISRYEKSHSSAAAPHLRLAPMPHLSAPGSSSMHSTLSRLKRPVPAPINSGQALGSTAGPRQSSLTAMPIRRPILPNARNRQRSLHSTGSPVPPTPHGIGKRRTPTRSSLTAMRNRNLPPSMPVSLPLPLPHPATRRAPINQYSTRTSRVSSPKAGNQFYNFSPASPRLPLTARPDQRAELRRHVVHMLAAGDCGLDLLRKRLCIDSTSSMDPVLSGVLREVADRKSGVFSLRQSLWSDVSDGYEGYSDTDRAATRMRRSTLARPSVEHADPNPEGMTDAQLDKKISDFENTERDRKINRLRNSEEDAELRQRFQKWYSTYRTIIGRMEEMRRTFVRLEERYAGCQKAREKEALAQQIKERHERLRERKKRLENALPALHATLKSIREALEKGVRKSGE